MWDTVIQDAFGGPHKASSAHTLVYIDALKIDSLLGEFSIATYCFVLLGSVHVFITRCKQRLRSWTY